MPDVCHLKDIANEVLKGAGPDVVISVLVAEAESHARTVAESLAGLSSHAEFAEHLVARFGDLEASVRMLVTALAVVADPLLQSRGLMTVENVVLGVFRETVLEDHRVRDLVTGVQKDPELWSNVSPVVEKCREPGRIWESYRERRGGGARTRGKRLEAVLQKMGDNFPRWDDVRDDEEEGERDCKSDVDGEVESFRKLLKSHEAFRVNERKPIAF